MGKQLNALERLDRVAKAEVAAAYLSGLRALAIPLTLLFAALAIASEAPRYETMAVRALAVFTLLTTIALWSRWRYAGYLGAAVCVLVGVGAFWFGKHPETPIDWVFRILYPLSFVAMSIEPWRKTKIFAACQGPEWQSERSQVQEWLERLRHPENAGGIVEFPSGSFWTGYFTYRLLDLDPRWAVAKFKRNGNALADYRIRDRSAVRIAQSPGGTLTVEVGGRRLGKVDPSSPAFGGAMQLITRNQPNA